MSGIQLTTLVMIGTDCTGSSKSIDYYTHQLFSLGINKNVDI